MFIKEENSEDPLFSIIMKKGRTSLLPQSFSLKKIILSEMDLININ